MINTMSLMIIFVMTSLVFFLRHLQNKRKLEIISRVLNKSNLSHYNCNKLVLFLDVHRNINIHELINKQNTGVTCLIHKGPEWKLNSIIKKYPEINESMLDKEGTISKNIGLYSLPAYILIDSNNKVIDYGRLF